MSPRSQEQFEKIREEKKALILDTALELFAMKGYHNSTISQIAKHAGISKGLIYNYYSGKEDLLEAVLRDGFGRMVAMMVPDDGILDTREEFIELIDKVFASVKADKKYWRLYYTLLFHPGFYDIYKIIYKEAVDAYDKIVCEYYKVKKEKNPEIMAHTLGAVIDGVSMAYIIAPEYFPLDEIKKIIIEKFS